jgi:hypothetical protein
MIPRFPQRTEIAELRHECTELRQANLSLERQVREGLIAAVCIPFLLVSPRDPKQKC